MENFIIGVVVLAWNERILLPHFLRHYLPVVDKIEIYDNGTTDNSIEIEISKLSKGNKKKIIVHDISNAKGIYELNKIQNTLWKDAAEKYDIVIHVDVDEFIVSDRIFQTLRECIKDFYFSDSTFANVSGYECTLSLNREICESDDIVSIAARGYPYNLLDRPCILKPANFKEWNLMTGRHEWSPKGKIRKWNRHPILKHIRGANIELVMQRRMEINKNSSLLPWKYPINLMESKLLSFANGYVNIIYKLNLVDRFGDFIPSDYDEQIRLDIIKYMSDCAKILEIGGRFGVVSCVINFILKNKKKHIVVEPDKRVWEALRTNKQSTNSGFHILKGAISSDKVCLTNWESTCGKMGKNSRFRIGIIPYVSPDISIYTYDEIKKKYGFCPDTLVVTCEGAFVEIFRDFPEMLDDMKHIFIEWDAINNRNNIFYKEMILKRGFKEIKGGYNSVYERFDEKRYEGTESLIDVIKNSDSLRILSDVNKQISGVKFHTYTHILYDIRTILGPEPKIYTEIGTFIGSSAALMLQHPEPTTVVCIDPLNLPPGKFQLKITQEKTFRNNMNVINIHKKDIIVHKKYSTDKTFLQQLKCSGFTTDILFIDGDHSCLGVISDFNNFHEFVSPGGYIVFDDYNDSKYCPQVRGAVDTIVRQIKTENLKYEIIGVFPNYQDATPQVTVDNESTEFILRKM